MAPQLRNKIYITKIFWVKINVAKIKIYNTGLKKKNIKYVLSSFITLYQPRIKYLTEIFAIIYVLIAVEYRSIFYLFFSF